MAKDLFSHSYLPNSLLLSLSELGLKAPTRPREKVIIVKWARPGRGWAKLNADGSACRNRGLSRGGGIYRNDNGDLLFAFPSAYGMGSNVNTELRAIHNGLYHCLNNGYSNVLVESDSKLVVDWLNGASVPALKWKYWINRIEIAKCHGNFRFVHAWREGNAPADWKARQGIALQSSSFFSHFSQGPPQIRGHLFLDKVGLGAIKHSV